MIESPKFDDLVRPKSSSANRNKKFRGARAREGVSYNTGADQAVPGPASRTQACSAIKMCDRRSRCRLRAAFDLAPEERGKGLATSARWNPVDVSACVMDYNEAILPAAGCVRTRKRGSPQPRLSAPRAPAVGGLGSPMGSPSKIVCIGLNIAITRGKQMDIPKEPVVFFKSTNALGGANYPLRIPRRTKVDLEGELAVVIGKKANYVPRPRALGQ